MFGIKKDNRFIVAGGNNSGSISLPVANNYGEYIVRNSNSFVIGGTSNVFLGCNSGFTLQGSNALAIGFSSGYSNQNGGAIAIGTIAGLNDQNSWSVAIGSEAGQNNQGIRAIAIGQVAGKNQQANDSIAMGLFSAWQSTGSNSISIGRGTSYNGIGVNSISIGSVDGDLGINQQSSGSNSIIINATGLAQTAAPNTIVLNADPSGGIIPSFSGGTYINPIRSAGVENALYYNSSTKEITYTPSTREEKKDIQPISLDTSSIYVLQPSSFSYKNDDSSNIGLIAEDVFEIDKKLCVVDKNDKPVNINWNVLSIYLLEELKNLKKEIEILKKN
jgi:hypothetical protein